MNFLGNILIYILQLESEKDYLKLKKEELDFIFVNINKKPPYFDRFEKVNSNKY